MTARMPAVDVVHVVDDDAALRDSLTVLLQAHGFEVSTYESAEQFLLQLTQTFRGCVLMDVNMPGMSGMALLQELKNRCFQLPCIVMTGAGQVSLAVKAMKLGAVDFIEKPFETDMLVESLSEALQRPQNAEGEEGTSHKLSRLTPREREVMLGIANGQQNKVIANNLGISPRTVEIHRARVMAKLEANSLADVVKLALAQAGGSK